MSQARSGLPAALALAVPLAAAFAPFGASCASAPETVVDAEVAPPADARADAPGDASVETAGIDFEHARADVERILQAALRDGRTWDKLVELCTTAPHRLAGSQGAADAVAWAKRTMEAEGLENVRLEPCRVPHWERGEVEELVLTAPPELAGTRLPILALGGSVATPAEGVEAEVIAVQSFEELQRRADEARGRIVLFNRAMDPTKLRPFEAYGGAVGQRSRGAVETAKVGGVAALVRSMTTRHDDVPHTGALRYAEDVARVPSAAVSTNGADRIAASLRSGATVRARLTLSCAWHEEKDSYNVVGEWIGRELPDEVVVVGGHLDAWDVGQGAHDDGAGCCQSIEAVRLLKSLGLRPRRTIRVVLFMNEENGLRGGRAYHATHADAMDRHVMAIESDRGAFTPRGFTTDANPEALAILRAAAALFDGVYADRVVEGGGGADISPMRADGVVLVGYLPDPQRYFDLHHTAEDTLDKVNPRELELGSGLIAALAWLVADLPDALPRNTAPE